MNVVTLSTQYCGSGLSDVLSKVVSQSLHLTKLLQDLLIHTEQLLRLFFMTDTAHRDCLLGVFVKQYRNVVDNPTMKDGL